MSLISLLTSEIGMQGPLSLELGSNEVGENRPLIRYLMDDPVYRSKYVSYVGETAITVFTPERMKPIYNASHELVRPYVLGNSGEIQGYTLLQSEDKFDEAIVDLRNHVEERCNEGYQFHGNE